MIGRTRLMMGFFAWCVAMCAMRADAGMMYSFRVESPNYTYNSVITIGSMYSLHGGSASGLLAPVRVSCTELCAALFPVLQFGLQPWSVVVAQLPHVFIARFH